MARPQPPVYHTTRGYGIFWIYTLVLLWMTGISVSSPMANGNSHCVTYAATSKTIGSIQIHQAAPSPAQPLPVAVYQVAPSATYQILDQDNYPLLCLNISCFPHGDYHSQRCSWEVDIGHDRECLQYSSEGSILLSRDGEDAYMTGPDPANYPIISHVGGDVFISLNGRNAVKLASSVGDAEYLRLLNVGDKRSTVKFPSIDNINVDHNCLVMNPCTLIGFEHVPWYLSMRQGDILYLKSFPNEKAKLSVYNMCSKEWAHGTGNEPSLLSIPSNDWTQIDIKTSKISTEIVVADQHHHYKFQALGNYCDEDVYIIAVAGASFSLSCDANSTSHSRRVRDDEDEDETFGSSMWLWLSIGAAILGLIVAMSVISLCIVQKAQDNVNHPMHPYVRRISDLRLLIVREN